MTVPLDAQCHIEPSPDLRSIDDGRILIGGAPLRILRLRTGGAELIRGWFAGQPIDDQPAHHDLARRLERNGMATIRWPEPAVGSPRPRTAVIIPSHNDQDELHRTLATGITAWADETIVVDDGSTPPLGPLGPQVTVLRQDRPGGPGSARQRGLEATSADVVL
ncbi:MAG: glycosyltransferase, partial [Actinomycetota bacterium]